MAGTRDLSYLINFNVQGAAELATAAGSMETLESSANGLSTANAPAIDLGLEDLADAPGNVDDLGTSLVDLEEPASTATGVMGSLVGTIGNLGLGAIGVQAAIELGTRAWGAWTDKAREVEERTRAISAALDDTSGALAGITDSMAGFGESGDAAERVVSALNEADPDLFRDSVVAIGELGGSYTELGGVLSGVAGDGEDAVAALADLAVAHGLPPEVAGSIASAVEGAGSMRDVTTNLQRDISGLGDTYTRSSDSLGEHTAAWDAAGVQAADLTEKYGDQIGALLDLNNAADSFDLESIAQGQLDVAAGADLATQALLAQAEANVGVDASALDTWREFIDLQNEAADTQRWQDYQDIVGSTDWGAAELQGATTAMEDYTAAQFGAADALAEQMDAIDELGKGLQFQTDANGELAVSMDVASEAGRATLGAMRAVADVVDNDLAVAYDNANGSQEDFIASADLIRGQLVIDLQNQLGITADQANAVADALHLTEGDFAARFTLAGAEEAKIQLGLLSGIIDSLPADVQTTITQQIIAGDYTGALATLQATIDAAAPPTAELHADTAPFVDETGAIVEGIPPVEVTVSADTAPAEEDIDAIVQVDHPVTFVASADTAQAEEDIKDTTEATRTATIVAEADTSALANSGNALWDGLWSGTAATVTSTVTVEGDFASLTDGLALFDGQSVGTTFLDVEGEFTPIEGDLATWNGQTKGEIFLDVEGDFADINGALSAYLAQRRTLTIDAILGSYPTAADIAARVGAVRIPIDYYVRSDPRVNGSRSLAGSG